MVIPGHGRLCDQADVTVTSSLRPGYLRNNGVPYSANTKMTEYYDIHQVMLLVVAHTYEEGVIRIISARRATKNERRQYESEG